MKSKKSKDYRRIFKNLVEMNPSLTSEYRCSLCKGDLRKENVKGACSCHRSHPIGLGGSSIDAFSEETTGLYDMIRYIEDHR
jgi:hypothetical protein